MNFKFDVVFYNYVTIYCILYGRRDYIKIIFGDIASTEKTEQNE